VARAAGAAHVAITDVNRDRLDQAARLGADETLEGPEQRALDAVDADVVIECTGVDAVVSQAIAALRPAGRAVLVGMGAGAAQSLPTALLQSRELTVVGLFRYANTYPDAIRLVASGQINLRALVGARLDLQETERALQMGERNPAILKTVVAVS
jgi:L-iditol 2-dehydrogenase